MFVCFVIKLGPDQISHVKTHARYKTNEELHSVTRTTLSQATAPQNHCTGTSALLSFTAAQLEWSAQSIAYCFVQQSQLNSSSLFFSAVLVPPPPPRTDTACVGSGGWGGGLPVIVSRLCCPFRLSTESHLTSEESVLSARRTIIRLSRVVPSWWLADFLWLQLCTDLIPPPLSPIYVCV